MSQGARTCVLVVEAANDSDGRGWVFTLAFALVYNVMSRTHWIDKCLFVLSGGRWTVDNFRRLLTQTKFQGGYPPIIALLAVGVMRVVIGHPMIPNSAITCVTAGIVAENLLEDTLVFAAGYFRILPVFPTVDPQDKELRERISKKGSGSIVIKHATRDDREMVACSTEALDKEFLAWDFQHNLRDEFPALPLWAHFSAVMISQFHTVLFLIIFGGGLNFVLGFCNKPGYEGVGRGIVWWPLMEVSDPCGGEDF
mmetsp:Transcript_78934/g.221461  ORF Transcript_78934/g.221461 Transcript_78934/m.221461 type:complete len:254 (+) Transcript_78934:3-764(+)